MIQTPTVGVTAYTNAESFKPTLFKPTLAEWSINYPGSLANSVGSANRGNAVSV